MIYCDMGDAFDNITLNELSSSSNSSYNGYSKNDQKKDNCSIGSRSKNMECEKKLLPKGNKVYVHEYYVNDFLNSLKNADNVSTISDNFNHVKECKICRTMIKLKLSKKENTDFDYCGKNNNNSNSNNNYNIPNNAVVEQFSLPAYKESIVNTFTSSDNKSILVIILIGLLIIIVIDLFVRIGRRSKCYS